MTIAVLDYATGSICTFRDVEVGSKEEIEEFLYEQQRFNPDEIYYMFDESISLYIDNNSVGEL